MFRSLLKIIFLTIKKFINLIFVTWYKNVKILLNNKPKKGLMDHVDGSCWWIMLMNHVDGSCWWIMLMDHVDESCWWIMLMDHVDGSCWWIMLIVHFQCVIVYYNALWGSFRVFFKLILSIYCTVKNVLLSSRLCTYDNTFWEIVLFRCLNSFIYDFHIYIWYQQVELEI